MVAVLTLKNYENNSFNLQDYSKNNNKKSTHKCIFKISKVFNLSLKMLTEPDETS